MRATFPRRRSRWANGRVAQHALPDTPVGVGTVPPACGDSTTYVRDRAHDGGLGDNRRCSSAPGSGRTRAPRRNSQAGHKKKPESLCCVTTPPGLRPAFPPEALPPRSRVSSDARLRHAAGLAALAPPPHAPDELPAADAAVAAAWRPASDARVSGTPGVGSTADSTAGPGRRGDTRGAGRSAGQDSGRWSKKPGRDYAGAVPRGGSAPGGAAREIG
jgi:hypothetical protein